MMIGTPLSARRRLHTSRPSSFGSITSRTTRSTRSAAKRASASSPSRAWTTRKPSRSSGYARSFWTASSSSTSRIVEESGIAAPAGARRSASYYSQGMAALPPRPSRRRPRRGTLERPVSGRLYRGTWLLVGIPLLAAAFSVHKPESLPAPQPALPASFDRFSAVELASELSRLYPDRVPGTAGAAGAVAWVRAQLAPYGLQVVADRFRADLPGIGRRTLVNQLVTVPGRSPDELVVLAHRDDTGTGPGANNNASGIAALIQLARSYGSPQGASVLRPQHTLVFV